MSIDWDGTTSAIATALRSRGIESDLGDAELVAYASAARAEIAQRGYGPRDDVDFVAFGSGTLISLDPPAASIADVEEAGVALVADTDYRLRPGGMYLERISGGYPTGWNGRVTGTITVAESDDRYDRVVVDLVKLALQYTGLDSRRDGDYAEEAAGARTGGQKGYQQQREEIIEELRPAGALFA